jgi:hypothetical protein
MVITIATFAVCLTVYMVITINESKKATKEDLGKNKR